MAICGCFWDSCRWCGSVQRPCSTMMSSARRSMPRWALLLCRVTIPHHHTTGQHDIFMPACVLNCAMHIHDRFAHP